MLIFHGNLPINFFYQIVLQKIKYFCISSHSHVINYHSNYILVCHLPFLIQILVIFAYFFDFE